MTYAEAQHYLRERKSRGVSLGLDRMRAWMQALGNPERAVPCIHIAGTNGKGSVAAMIDSMLRAAGWRTGLYTSPHLIRLGERVQVNRAEMADDEIAAAVSDVAPIVDQIERDHGPDAGPSFFEFMTGLALRHFQLTRCDIAVIEVGLGGRLDATNIVAPEVAAITSIGLDHCEFLGDSITAIAREKAGIIKPGMPVVIGRLPAGAEQVIRAIAAERRAPVFSVRDVFGDSTQNYPATSLPGEYQRWNAATATLVARQLHSRWRMTGESVSRGLADVRWAARWQEFYSAGRRVIVDASHNAEGAQVLAENLRALTAGAGRRPIVVVGVLGEARARPLLRAIAPFAAEIVLTMPRQKRACSFEEMEALLSVDALARTRRAPLDELFSDQGKVRLGGTGDTIVVTGSIYLAGEVLARLHPPGGAAETDLQDF